MKLFMFICKVLVSTLLIAFVLIRWVDWPSLRAVVLRLDFGLISLALAMRFIGLLPSSLRWQKILQAQTICVPLRSLYDSYVIASFFNLFMPTSIGGDVSRVNDICRFKKSISESLSSVFMERLLGVVVLLSFASIASLAQLPLANQIPAIWIALLVGVAGLAGLFLSLYTPFVSYTIRLLPLPRAIRQPLEGNWKVFRDNTTYLFSRKSVLSWGIWYSVLLQGLVVLHYWIIGKALGFSVPLYSYFSLIPVQLLVLMLPSINGIGLREASSIILLGYFGITPAEATTFGFMDFALMVVLGIVGYIRFITRGKKIRSVSAVAKP
jgi:hypothetical protein